ncbi:unnamed protein product [Adineta ricciae]|uniref:Fucosyltransferase n=1 Tax=Adineta ricciae TaxID=249248 RepID=A0A814KWD0_ADIRI|nr:unnamed protein product [Adineta ricciae]
MISLIVFIQINVSSILVSTLNENVLELPDTNVIYPVDVINKIDVNTSISYYLSKKDELKFIDDANTANRQQKIVLPLIENKENMSSVHLVLEYTNVFSRPKFCSHKDEDIFGRMCPYTNCKYTCNQTYEKDAQVLLMHKRDLDYKKLDKLKRNPNQIWLLWHDEPNERSPELNKYKFNWTISYRTSAEASIGAYGLTIVKDKPWSSEQFNSWIDEQFTKKHNQAVWFVSNCSPKKRLAKFRSLRQHYPIVAFGRCIRQNESFSFNTHNKSASTCARQTSCETDYLSSSKFYLAFESQSCTDYITEKFWRTFTYGAVPIVSGPERENYVRVAPPNSFIHVDDYASDDQLAEALHSVANNRSLYEKYHYWRRYYDVRYLAKDIEPYRFCELCYRLNTNKQRIWYENISDWFLDKC